MILDVEFNTEEKAKKCLELLGTRGIDIMTIIYKETRISGFIVHYFRLV